MLEDAMAINVDEVETVDHADEKKTIILFSDGTGNNSGKLHKTNIWRMYQAVDLGVPQKRDERVQIGRYDNGVASSTFRLLAMLQGIFGWGLKRNILSLYLFLCSNFRPGDRICLFGFSRGAFTIRVLVDLIDKQGVIPHDRGDALNYLVRDAYRAYRKGLRPRMLPMRWLAPLLKWIASHLRVLSRILRLQQRYDPARNHRPDIAFVGVWDTVSAYGGPILEFVRGVDDWIKPISFKDKQLPARVNVARHALALDDERDSFQPLPWDETRVSRERLQQVWFAGMHSDVGGGYPDDSLSYVSFNWMLNEAREHGEIRFREDRVKEARLQADAFGPIHDSRGGLAAYYRYQPRKISALLWPRAKGVESMVDPEQPDGQGMRRPALIHESVFRRILSGTDGYSPIAISRGFEIVEDGCVNRSPRLPARHQARFSCPRWQKFHDTAQEGVWDFVWWRRIVYFLIVLASLALAASPLFIEEIGYKADGVAVALVRVPFNLLKSLGNSPFDWWLEAFIFCPLIPLALAIFIVALFKLTTLLDRGLRVRSRTNWSAARPDPEARPPRKSPIYRFRSHWTYQDVLRFTRWNLLPSVVGIGMLVLLGSLTLSLATVARLTWNEIAHMPASDHPDLFCGPAPPPPPAGGGGGDFWMSTDDPCNMSVATVKTGTTYEVILAIPDGGDWRDGSRSTSPEGVAAGGLMPRRSDWLFTLMRRYPDARWMQPLIYIVPGQRQSGSVTTQPLREISRAGRRLYRAQFTAERDGHVAVAVNEAIAPWPFPHDYFYRGGGLFGSDLLAPRNSGRACVRIAELNGKGEQAAPPDCDPQPSPGRAGALSGPR